MATVTKNNLTIREADVAQSEQSKAETLAECVELRLSDRDRDIFLAALDSTQPNRALQIAAKKYKKQCD